MKKIFHLLQQEMIYNPAKSRAPWTIDGIHHMNGGQRFEGSAHEYFEGAFTFDRKAVPFDKGSDIESLRISVKSHGCSLACLYRPRTDTAKAEIITEYFQRTASEWWLWAEEPAHRQMVFYIMDATEFRQFLELFGELGQETGKDLWKIRVRSSKKLVRWLEAQL